MQRTRSSVHSLEEEPPARQSLTFSGATHFGERHGSGSMADCRGRVLYDGDWRSGYVCGEGTVRVGLDGPEARGVWQRGGRRGRGTVAFRNGAGYFLYVGDLVLGVPGGEGVLYRVSDEEEGEPLEVDRAGAVVAGSQRLREVYRGSWANGVFHGAGREAVHGEEALAEVYEGGFVRGCRSGEASLCCYARGLRYVGSFRAGVLHGRGLVRDISSGGRLRYDGEWAHGVPSGAGTVHFPGRQAFACRWANGVLLPRGAGHELTVTIDREGRMLCASGDPVDIHLLRRICGMPTHASAPHRRGFSRWAKTSRAAAALRARKERPRTAPPKARPASARASLGPVAPARQRPAARPPSTARASKTRKAMARQHAEALELLREAVARHARVCLASRIKEARADSLRLLQVAILHAKETGVGTRSNEYRQALAFLREAEEDPWSAGFDIVGATAERLAPGTARF